MTPYLSDREIRALRGLTCPRCGGELRIEQHQYACDEGNCTFVIIKSAYDLLVGAARV